MEFLISFLVISIVGTLLHFVYEWSNHNKIVSLFTALQGRNEYGRKRADYKSKKRRRRRLLPALRRIQGQAFPLCLL